MLLDYSVKTENDIINIDLKEIYFVEDEEWIDISDKIFPGIQPWYRISSWGRVWSKLNNIFIKPRLIGHGYPIVTLRFNSDICGFSSSDILIHRLVKMCFTPICNMDMYQVNHKDCNMLNNYIYNLEWCTNEYNNLYRYKMKERNMFLYYNNINLNLLNDDELRVIEICKLLEKCVSYRDICIAIYGVFDEKYMDIIAHIDHRRNWVYISDYYNVNQKGNAKSLFTDEQVHIICRSIQNGYTNQECSDIIGIYKSDNNHRAAMLCISKIRRRLLFKNIVSQYDW